MVTFRTAMVIILGIFLGILIYGVQTIIINYNCVVNPDQPLQILSLEKENHRLSFLGEKYALSPAGIRELRSQVLNEAAKFKKTTGDFFQQVVGKYNYFRDYFAGCLHD